MNFKLAHKATADLAGIWSYINTTWGAEQADTYLDALYLRFIWLTNNSSLWRPRNDVHAELYDYHEGSHVIFFREYDKGIEIVRILHDRMDVIKHL